MKKETIKQAVAPYMAEPSAVCAYVHFALAREEHLQHVVVAQAGGIVRAAGIIAGLYFFRFPEILAERKQP